MAKDPDALVCDMAETYRVYDFRSVPLRTLATLAAGLGPESRVMRRVSGMQATRAEVILATIADGINTLVWMKTKDGRKGRNRPKRIIDAILGKVREQDAPVGFATADEFEEARRKIMEGS